MQYLWQKQSFFPSCRLKHSPRKQRPKQAQNIHQIGPAPPQSESEDEYIFRLTRKKTKSPAVEVKINNITYTHLPLTSESIAVRYPKIFDGIGKLKDFKVKLHIDEISMNQKQIYDEERPDPF